MELNTSKETITNKSAIKIKKRDEETKQMVEY